LNTIRSILHNNQYNINKRNKRPKKKNAQNDTQQQKAKWATFTYNGKEVRKITKLFRDTQIKITFRTRNSIQIILRHKPLNDKYSRSGIYQIKCLDCPLKYIGQTARTFNIRYKNHMQAIGDSNNNYRYSNQILNTGHTYGTINDTMDIIRKEKTGKHFNTLKKYHIHKISEDNLQMNDAYNNT
jgi:hypothetical protein